MEAFGHNARDRRAVGLAGVALLHVLVVYALVTGLGKDLVKVIQQKVEVAVISEPPPPPPPPPPPKIEKVMESKAPPPPQQQQAYVPPPVVAPTTQSTSTIQATSDVKATSAPAVPHPVAAPAAASTGPISAVGNCSKRGTPEYPRKALAEDIQGLVTVWFKVNTEGRLSDISNIKFSSDIPPNFRSQFQSAVKQALQGHVCKSNLGEAVLEQEFNFKLESE